MKKIFFIILISIFIIPATLSAAESEKELKTYLTEMNKIVIEVEEAMRNLSMKILPAKNATEQISGAIEKFEVLSAPSLFSADHNSMLSAFKTIRDGLKLFSENEREESIRLVREGAALLKKAAISLKTKAEEQGLIPVRPKTGKTSRPILPSQTPTVIAGISPTSSPRISSPGIEGEFRIAGAGQSSVEINLEDIRDSAKIATIPRMKVDAGQGMSLPSLLTAAGEIVSIEKSKGYFILGIKDASGNISKINFNPKISSILKNNKIVDIGQITKGEYSYVLYTQTQGKNQAVFVNILKAEDIDAFKNAIKAAP